jgi:DNA mismatch repair protein MutS2
MPRARSCTPYTTSPAELRPGHLLAPTRLTHHFRPLARRLLQSRIQYYAVLYALVPSVPSPVDSARGADKLLTRKFSVPPLLPSIPDPLTETSASTLEWPRLRVLIAGRCVSPLGRAWTLALEPCACLPWIGQQSTRTADLRQFLSTGGSFDFHGLFDPQPLLERARIPGSALEPMEILEMLNVAERVAAWRALVASSESGRRVGPAIRALTEPLLPADLAPLLRTLRGKIEPDGSLADDASPELRRIRRAAEAQHRAIEASLRRASARLRDEGSSQSGSDDVITVRGERFVIPIRAEFKRRVPGVIHGSSSTGQTVFVEPLETIEHNNELVRLLDEEQAEIHRILVVLTAALAGDAPALALGAGILAEVESHAARARFAMDFDCTTPTFGTALAVKNARHPLLEQRMREQARNVNFPVHSSGVPSIPGASEWVGSSASSKSSRPVPLTLRLEPEARELIISGPNTGGKTVSLKTTGLLALMAQAGLPVPADEATFPLFTAVFADIGDAQSIERDLSSFSAHVRNLDHISRHADASSLVLLDELGSATDPEEGAALAVALAGHFLRLGAWTCITTHLTSLKVYAAQHTDKTPGVLNAAVGFDQQTLAPTYELRLGVPGASAGLNIAERLGLSPSIMAEARAQMTTQQADIGAFLDQLHSQLSAATAERVSLKRRTEEVAVERAKLETEGRAEQKQLTRELEQKLQTLLEDFDFQLKESVREIEDKTVARKIARDSALRMARLRREFSEQFASTVLAHKTGADRSGSPRGEGSILQRRPDPFRGDGYPARLPGQLGPGDLVMLRSLRRQARVERILDTSPDGEPRAFEVSIGQMKMRVPLSDIDSSATGMGDVVAVPAQAVEGNGMSVAGARRPGERPASTKGRQPQPGSQHSPHLAPRPQRGAVSFKSFADLDYTPTEINVIGRTADEAETEVSRYLDRAFLAGLPRVRIVHGTGMGVLRRTLRDFLKTHAHVQSHAEATQQEGGQGATIVELRQ